MICALRRSFSTAAMAKPLAPVSRTLDVAVVERHVGVTEVEPSSLVVFCHATGFSKEVWTPVIDDLDVLCREANESVHTIAIDISGHGDSWRRGDVADPRDWGSFCASDVGEALETVLPRFSGKRILGVGHSMGGAALILADLEGAAPFERIVAFEPVVFPFPAPADSPLSKAAAKRRSHWSSLQDVSHYFEGRKAFKSWDPRSLRAMIDGSVMPTASRYAILPPDLSTQPPAKRRYTLKCNKDFESLIYTGWHNAFERLPHVKADTTFVIGAETEFLAGTGMDTLTMFTDMTTMMRQAKCVVMDGTTHFGPMERPGRFAYVVAKSFGWEVGSPVSRL